MNPAVTVCVNDMGSSFRLMVVEENGQRESPWDCSEGLFLEGLMFSGVGSLPRRICVRSRLTLNHLKPVRATADCSSSSASSSLRF